MLWGTFTPTHIATLVLAVIIVVAIYVALSFLTRKRQIITLFILSFVGIGAIIYNILYEGGVAQNLPLNFWSLSALILPYAILTRQKWCCNLLLFWSLESLFALVLNHSMADTPILSIKFVVYFLSHMLIFGIPILLFALGLVDRDLRTVKSTLSLAFLTYTFVHFVNVAINSAGLLNSFGDAVNVNYMYSITPANAFLNILYLIIPSSYWYMFLILPFVLFYVCWLYMPEILEYMKRRRILKAKLRAVNEYYDEYKEEYIEEIIEND